LISHCKKKRRRALRNKSALQIAPRPVAGLLRPIVQCPTIRYNSKQRQGKGFTLEELKKKQESIENLQETLEFQLILDVETKMKNIWQETLLD